MTIGDDAQRIQNQAKIYVKLVDLAGSARLTVRDYGASARESLAAIRVLQPAHDCGPCRDHQRRRAR